MSSWLCFAVLLALATGRSLLSDEESLLDPTDETWWTTTEEIIANSTEKTAWLPEGGDEPAWSSTDEPAWSSTDEPAWSSTDEPAWSSTHEPAWSSTHEPAWSSTHEPAWSSTHEPARSSTHEPARLAVSPRQAAALLWAHTFQEVLNRTIANNVWEPYLTAFSSTSQFVRGNSRVYQFDEVTQSLLDRTSFKDLYLNLVKGDVANEMGDEVKALTTRANNIVTNMPHWLDVEALEGIDVTLMRRSHIKRLVNAIVSVTDVPQPQRRAIDKLMNSVDHLSERAAAMGRYAAFYNVKMHNYLLKSYPRIANYMLSMAFKKRT